MSDTAVRPGGEGGSMTNLLGAVVRMRKWEQTSPEEKIRGRLTPRARMNMALKKGTHALFLCLGRIDCTADESQKDMLKRLHAIGFASENEIEAAVAEVCGQEKVEAVMDTLWPPAPADAAARGEK